jgi:hypothetical protein
MTDQNKRLIVIVLDRSGSMQTVKEDTEGGLRAFLDTQKEAPGDTLVTLRQFDHHHDTVYENMPLEAVPAYELIPRGMTALRDAVGSTVAEIGQHLESLPENDRPGEVVVVILTDGHDTASKEYTGEQVSQMINHQRERYGWEFLFLGADQDAIAAGGRMGIRAETSLAYGSAHTSVAMASAGKAVARGRRTGHYGFTEDERTRSGLGDGRGNDDVRP